LTRTRPNEHLAAVVREANISHKALARSVREVSAREGRPVGADHTSVSRWLDGTTPPGKTPIFIAQALSARLGRRVTLEDIGMSRVDNSRPDIGLGYDDAMQTASTLAQLWRADLDEIPSFVGLPTAASAWTEASLRWLVRAERDRLPGPAEEGRRVGMADVAAIRSITMTFGKLGRPLRRRTRTPCPR
jgi:hypothetical protein